MKMLGNCLKIYFLLFTAFTAPVAYSQLGVPKQVYPPEGAILYLNSQVVFQWDAVPGATYYDFEFDAGTGWVHPQYNLTSPALPWPNDGLGTHTWRVRARNSTTTGEWTNPPRSYNVVEYKPDLKVTSVSLSNTSLQAGNTYNVSFTLQNLGPAPTTGTSRTGFYLGTSSDDAQTYLAEYPTASITSVNGATSGNQAVTIPANTAPGDYYIVVYADYQNSISEASETNNKSGKQVTVFKFAVTSATISVSPTTVNLGQSATGSGSITGAGSGTVTYVWEYQKPGSSSWSQYGTAINVTMTNNSATIPSITLAPPFDNTGTYIFQVKTTIPNQITSSPKSVNVPEPPKPDLKVTSVNLSNTSLQAGNTYNVSFTLQNLGPAPTTGTSLTGFYLGNASDDAQTYLAQYTTSSITSVNGTTSGTQAVTIPANTVPGNYYIVVYADYQNLISEALETNNKSGKQVNVFKFAVTSATLSVTPATVSLGQSATGSGSISGAGSGQVTYVWEYQKPGSSSWFQYDTPTNVTMTNNSATIPSISLTPPFDTPGTYTFRVRTTSPNEIISSPKSITVPEPPKPDLTVTNVSLDKIIVQAGGSVNVTYTLKNEGPAASTGTSLTGIYLGASHYASTTFLKEVASESINSVNGTLPKTQGVIIPENTLPGEYYIVVFADYDDAIDEGTNEDDNINSTAISVFKFQVTSAEISVTPTSVTSVSDPITTSAILKGEGSGTVQFKWQQLKPGSSVWEDLSGLPETTTMTNGSATIGAATFNPFSSGGQYTLRVVTISPNAITSNETEVFVGNDVLFPEIYPLRISQDGNQKFYVIAKITDQGSGIDPSSVKLIYMKVPTEVFELDKGSVLMTKINNSDVSIR
jgi:trimeric autotransporter adhesin